MVPLPLLQDKRWNDKLVKLGPWLRPKGRTYTGQIIRTVSAYKLSKLLYHLPSFGGLRGLANLLIQGKLLAAVLQCLPCKIREAFQNLQRHNGDHTAESDTAAKELASYLDNPELMLAVRLPSLAEIEEEAEVGTIFAHSPNMCEIMSEETKLALIGNFFKPSAFEAAIFGAPDQIGFEHFCVASAYPASGVKPARIEEALTAHATLKDAVKQLLCTRKHLLSSLQESYVPPQYAYLLKTGFFRPVFGF